LKVMQSATKIQRQDTSNIAWHFLEGTSQEFALVAPCNVILYTGTRGPGKTDTQLMRFRRRVGIGYGQFWRGIIFDREYKNLDDLVAKSKRWFPSFNDGAQWLSAAKDYKWVWPTGEELLFRAIQKNDDYNDYHGHEYTFIGWNELVKYPTSYLFDAMMSTNRSSFVPDVHTPSELDDPLPPIPLEVFATTNPLGAGHNWVKRRFIDVAPYGKIVEQRFNVFNPRTQQQEEIVRTQVAIFGSYRENKFLDPIYVANLESDTDENRKKAWLHGNWDIVAGGAMDDVWDRRVHVIPRFKIPAGWRVDRSLDWGSTHPFSVGWWAEANGEEATLDNGVKFCPPPKTLIQIHEWYGAKEIGTNIGMKLSAHDIANGIKLQDSILLRDGWITETPRAGPADNQIRDVREVDVETIEKKMAKQGIKWVESDKSPGSRRNGLQLIRDRLEATKRNTQEPHLYFMDHCISSISTIPVLPRDEKKFDDVDTDAEDHAYDMLRYRVLHQPVDYFGSNVVVRFPT
jgi:hypothetical protein